MSRHHSSNIADFVIEQEEALYGPFFGQLGVTFSMIFAAAGAAYATAKVSGETCP
jgi:hypothetical protein